MDRNGEEIFLTRLPVDRKLNLHNLAEEKHPVTEAERIPVEKINGHLTV